MTSSSSMCRVQRRSAHAASLSVYARLSVIQLCAPHRTALHCTALHWSATPDTCFYERQLRSARYSLITVSVDFHFLFLALPAHSPRGSRQGLCNGRAVCQSRHSPAASAGLLLSARRTADIDQLLHVASAAGAPCSGAQQQMRAVPR